MHSGPTLPSYLVAETGREGLAQLAAIVTDEMNREALPSAMKQALQDVAISTTFGPAQLARFSVVTDEVKDLQAKSGHVVFQQATREMNDALQLA
jgi:hypothetical protein